MNENNNDEAPVVAPGTDVKCNNAVSSISHIPLPQRKTAAMETRPQVDDAMWKSKFEDTEKRRKSLLTQTQIRK
jgi:hypothetical protein